MRIIPVLDLKGGLVVHAVRGDRATYKPVQSRLTHSAAPRAVAAAFAELGFRTIYVADLDAIAGERSNLELYRDMLAIAEAIWLDVGLSSVERAIELSEFARSSNVTGIIAGLESLGSPRLLAAIARRVNPDRLVFSLDLKRGSPFTAQPGWARMTPVQIVQYTISLGVRRVIVLDLADVGAGTGASTVELCREIRLRYGSDLELVAGGGVRSLADLAALRDAGCSAALVATALHNGAMTRDDLQEFSTT